jgi:hypothetical protein
VSDFSLMDAIESGIVKLPRVPVTDNLVQMDSVVYRDLWKHTPVLKDLNLTVWQGATSGYLSASARDDHHPGPGGLRAKLINLGTVPSNLSEAEFEDFLKTKQEQFSQVVRAGNIRSE